MEGGGKVTGERMAPFVEGAGGCHGEEKAGGFESQGNLRRPLRRKERMTWRRRRKRMLQGN